MERRVGELCEFIEILAPQKRVGSTGPRHADACIRICIPSRVRLRPTSSCCRAITSTRWITPRCRFHIERNAMPRWRQSKCPSPRQRFGIVTIDESERVIAFDESQGPRGRRHARQTRAGVDGHLHLQGNFLVRALEGMPCGPRVSTTSGGTFFRRDSVRGRVLVPLLR